MLLSRLIDFGEAPVRALAAPRLLLGCTFSDRRDRLKIEENAGADTIGELARRRHEVTPIPSMSPLAGQAGLVIGDEGRARGFHELRT